MFIGGTFYGAGGNRSYYVARWNETAATLLAALAVIRLVIFMLRLSLGKSRKIKAWELRATLMAHGHTFRSRSDTEVLVHLWEDLGPAMVERLNGMYAFCLLDRRRGAVLLARDPVGIYLGTTSGEVWASTNEGGKFTQIARHLPEIYSVSYVQ